MDTSPKHKPIVVAGGGKRKNSRKRERSPHEDLLRSDIIESLRTLDKLRQQLVNSLYHTDGGSPDDKAKQFKAEARELAQKMLEPGVLWSEQPQEVRDKAVNHLHALYPEYTWHEARDRLMRYMSHKRRGTTKPVPGSRSDSNSHTSEDADCTNDEDDDQTVCPRGE